MSKPKTKSELSLDEIQKKLQEKFAATDVKQRSGGAGFQLDYIPIDKFYIRLNQILPLGYSWSLDTPIIFDKTVIVKGTLEIRLPDGEMIRRDGVGADKLGSDVDKAVKTAMAEAFKKACHTLGISLYLWDEDERKQVHKERQEAASVSRKFSSTQIDAMKSIKDSVGGEPGLATLLSDWSDEAISLPSKLHTGNIDSFITFAQERTTVGA